MTYPRGEVRLRDIPQLSRDGLIMLGGALLSFGMAGFMLTMVPAESQTRTLVRLGIWAAFLLLGLANMWGVDRELREVSD